MITCDRVKTFVSTTYDFIFDEDMTISISIEESLTDCGTPFSGAIYSRNIKSEDEGDEDYNSGIDGLESLLLALACEGIDISTAEYCRALETALDGVANNA